MNKMDFCSNILIKNEIILNRKILLQNNIIKCDNIDFLPQTKYKWIFGETAYKEVKNNKIKQSIFVKVILMMSKLSMKEIL